MKLTRKITISKSLYVLTVAVFMLGPVILGKALDANITKTWIETKESKLSLLRARSNAPNYALIGSSKTQNLFNSLSLSTPRLSFFNFGLAGRFISDHAFPLLASLPEIKDGVVWNLNADELNGELSCPDRLTNLESRFFKKYFPELECGPGEYRYGDIYTHYKSFLGVIIKYAIDTKLGIFGLAATGRKDTSSRTVNYVRGHRERAVILFLNGDGEVVSETFANKQTEEDGRLIEIVVSPTKQAFIAAFCRLYNEHGKKLFIHFEPIIYGVTIDPKKIYWTAPPHCRFFVTGDKYFPKSLWADHAHLNRKGIKIYEKLWLERFAQASVSDPVFTGTNP